MSSSSQKNCVFYPTIDEYRQSRKDFINEEINSSLGGDIKLSDKEKFANQVIMKAKEIEMSAGLIDPYGFIASRHHFEVLDQIKQSKVFQMIQKMPKAGLLHLHDTYMHTADDVVSLTYWPHLWQRMSNQSKHIEEFRFSCEKPQISNDDNASSWRLVKDAREEIGATKYDENIRPIFTLFDKNIHPKIQFKDINDVWIRFMDIVNKFRPIVTYAPIWKAYHKIGFQEMLNDGVQYFECRGFLPKVNFTKLFQIASIC